VKCHLNLHIDITLHYKVQVAYKGPIRVLVIW